MRFTIDTEQHIGQRREQQDAVRVRADLPGFPEGSLLAVVCDGMGGLKGGEEASRLAADAFTASFGRISHAEPVPDVMRRALSEAGRAVFQAARARGVEGDMGTTLVAALVEADRLHWLSVGDSRLYLVREGRLQQLNTEHTLGTRLREAVRSGRLSAEEAEGHPQRHALTSFLGVARLDEIDGALDPMTLLPGDLVLLCSDGLHGVLSDEAMGAVLAQAPRGREANALVSAVLAVQRPHQDNVTACVIVAETAPEPVTTQALPPMEPPAPPKPEDAGWKPLALLGLVLLISAAVVFFVMREGPTAPARPVDTLQTAGPRDSLRPDSLRPDSAAPAAGDSVRLRPGAQPPDTLPRPIPADSLRRPPPSTARPGSSV
ncbi:MAG TPA: protein phosphatase 2C domain-containing protein [Rhodothermales bacterium]|nr:protein phosphatase 2C domain-containing protein [Rhodothermales bacterium]